MGVNISHNKAENRMSVMKSTEHLSINPWDELYARYAAPTGLSPSVPRYKSRHPYPDDDFDFDFDRSFMPSSHNAPRINQKLKPQRPNVPFNLSSDSAVDRFDLDRLAAKNTFSSYKNNDCPQSPSYDSAQAPQERVGQLDDQLHFARRLQEEENQRDQDLLLAQAEARKMQEDWDNQDAFAVPDFAALQAEWDREDALVAAQSVFAQELFRKEEEREAAMRRDLAAVLEEQESWERDIREIEENRRLAEETFRREEEENRIAAAEAQMLMKKQAERVAKEEARREREEREREQREKKEREREQREREEREREQREREQREREQREREQEEREQREREKRDREKVERERMEREWEEKIRREREEAERRARMDDCVSLLFPLSQIVLVYETQTCTTRR